MGIFFLKNCNEYIEINTITLFDFRFLQLFLLIVIETNFCKIFASFGPVYTPCIWQKKQNKTVFMRGVATPKILQRFYLFRGCDNSIALARPRCPSPASYGLDLCNEIISYSVIFNYFALHKFFTSKPPA